LHQIHKEGDYELVKSIIQERRRKLVIAEGSYIKKTKNLEAKRPCMKTGHLVNVAIHFKITFLEF
jgi:hypothetical protein